MKSEDVKFYLDEFVKEGKATLNGHRYIFTNCEIGYYIGTLQVFMKDVNFMINCDDIYNIDGRNTLCHIRFNDRGREGELVARYQEAKEVTINYYTDDKEERQVANVKIEGDYLIVNDKKMLVKKCSDFYVYQLKKTFINANEGAQGLINYMRGVTDYDHVHPQAIVKWILQYGK